MLGFGLGPPPGGAAMEDDTRIGRVKEEPRGTETLEKVPHPPPDEAGMLGMDYNKLYGDLYRKLIRTPVGEIFPQFSSPATTSASPATTTSATISPLPAAFHPAFPLFGACAYPVNGHLGAPAGLGGLPTVPGGVQMMADVKPGQADEQSGMDPAQTHIRDALDAIYASQCKGIEDMDLEALVERFRDTLEKFGVSQRFAARFIMQDTSQGNLSFLMEKGKNRKWADLSPRGRIPYLRMKTWLESAEQQQYTLNMLKQSQDQKKASPRESYSRRERFSMFQIHVLCRLFEENPNPPMNVRNAVAERLNIPLDRVNVWFQNQRARGFPARKFLDQAFCEETPPAAYSASPTQSSRKQPGRRRSGDVCQDISNRGRRPSDLDVSALHRNIPRDIPKASAHDRHSRLTTPPKLDWSAMSPENCMQQPLDFSKTKPHSSVASISSSPPLLSSTATFGDLASSSSSIGALSEIVENVNSVRKSPEVLPSTTPTATLSSCRPDQVQLQGSNDKSASGAAKRKRGLKPQQIIHRTDAEEVNFETGSVQMKSKTDKVSEDWESVSPKRLKLDSSLDTVIPESERSVKCSITHDIAQENEETRIIAQANKHIPVSDKTLENGTEGDRNTYIKEEENCSSEVDSVNNLQEYYKKKESSANGGTMLSAEETIALVQTLYKGRLLEQPVNSSITEPDLD